MRPIKLFRDGQVKICFSSVSVSQDNMSNEPKSDTPKFALFGM